MTTLSGEDARGFIRNKPESEWIKIYMTNMNWIADLFTSLLYYLNYFLGPRLVNGTDDEYVEFDMAFVNETRLKITLLDHFLEKGVNEIRGLAYTSRVAMMPNLQDFSKLTVLSRTRSFLSDQ